MNYTYKYESIKGHIIAIVGQLRLLIDTGSPSSCADSSPIEFAGRSFSLPKCFLLSGTNIGTPVNGLIGTDILNLYDIIIDPKMSTLMVTEMEFALEGDCLDMEFCMGVPIIDATAAKNRIKVFFDTGAKLSYLDSEITEGLQPVGTESDFYPGVGDFTTDVYDVPITVGTETITLRVGNLPGLLQMTLMLANTRGIIGTALLQTYKIVYAPRRKKLALMRING